MQVKPFDIWNQRKKDIDSSVSVPFFHERQIWFCSLGTNVGFEQDGGDDFQRPIVIIRKFNSRILWGIPLTKSEKKPKKGAERYYYGFSFIDTVTSVAILSQIRLIDAKRLSRQIGVMPEKEFFMITKKLKELVP